LVLAATDTGELRCEFPAFGIASLLEQACHRAALCDGIAHIGVHPFKAEQQSYRIWVGRVWVRLIRPVTNGAAVWPPTNSSATGASGTAGMFEEAPRDASALAPPVSLERLSCSTAISKGEN